MGVDMNRPAILRSGMGGLERGRRTGKLPRTLPMLRHVANLPLINQWPRSGYRDSRRSLYVGQIHGISRDSRNVSLRSVLVDRESLPRERYPDRQGMLAPIVRPVVREHERTLSYPLREFQVP